MLKTGGSNNPPKLVLLCCAQEDSVMIVRIPSPHAFMPLALPHQTTNTQPASVSTGYFVTGMRFAARAVLSRLSCLFRSLALRLLAHFSSFCGETLLSGAISSLISLSFANVR
jgi:hypothetical protein